MLTSLLYYNSVGSYDVIPQTDKQGDTGGNGKAGGRLAINPEVGVPTAVKRTRPLSSWHGADGGLSRCLPFLWRGF